MKSTILLTLTAFNCLASIPDEQAIEAIYGESCGEPYKAKLGVAAVIRSRGSLKGVYGLHSKQLAHPDAKAMADCRKAWLESATNDITGGCFHFGGRIDDNYFSKVGMKPVLTIGNTRFYR